MASNRDSQRSRVESRNSARQVYATDQVSPPKVSKKSVELIAGKPPQSRDFTPVRSTRSKDRSRSVGKNSRGSASKNISQQLEEEFARAY